MHKFCRD